MKKYAVLLLLLSTCLCTQAQKSPTDAYGNPAAAAVADHVSQYLMPLSLDDGYKRYTLAKMKDGWHVRKEKYVDFDFQLEESALCWSAATHRYIKNDTINSAAVAGTIRKSIMSNLNGAYDYKTLPLYGYHGWAEQTIALYAGQPDLGDIYMESLARAYSSKALYANGQWRDFAWEAPPVKGSNDNYGRYKSQAAIDTLLKYEHLAENVYYRLSQKNPNYETLVGDVYTKYCNEVLSTYLILLYKVDRNQALKEMKPNLYTDFYVSFAKNLLNSCAQNGILLTQGDNDTYPLYYVQEQLGFRRDVLVVNSSLLALDSYIDFLRHGVFAAPPLPLTLDSAAYARDSLDYITRNDERFDQLVKATGLEFYPRTNTLFKNDIMLLDMIAANKWKRPIYIAMTASPDMALNMDKYLHYEGMAYRMRPEDPTDKPLPSADINTKFCYQYLMNDLILPDWHKPQVIDEAITRMVYNYAGLFSRVAEAMQAEGKNAECVKLLDRYVGAFPDSKVAYGIFNLTMPGLYYQCGRPAEAKALTEKLIANANKECKQHLDNYLNEEYTDWQRSAQEALYTLQQLQPLVKEHMPERSEKYDKDFADKVQKYQSVMAMIGPKD